MMEWDDGSGAIIKVVAGTATSFGSVGGYLQIPGYPEIDGGPLIQGTDGNLYGAAPAGGSGACPNGCGTVFRVTSAGVITVLYSFGSNAADGQTPSGAPVEHRMTARCSNWSLEQTEGWLCNPPAVD